MMDQHDGPAFSSSIIIHLVHHSCVMYHVSCVITLCMTHDAQNGHHAIARSEIWSTTIVSGVPNSGCPVMFISCLIIISVRNLIR